VVLNLGFGSEFLGDLKDHDVIAGPITNSSGEGRPLANRLGDFALERQKAVFTNIWSRKACRNIRHTPGREHELPCFPAALRPWGTEFQEDLVL